MDRPHGLHCSVAVSGADSADVEELRQALLEFQRLYNRSWIVERHGYRTPAQVRADQLGALAAAA